MLGLSRCYTALFRPFSTQDRPQNNPDTSDIIEAIVELSRPQRDGKPLDSLITFNFDSLIEEALENNRVKHKAIYTEGMRSKSSELPVYHVHGYLPRKTTCCSFKRDHRLHHSTLIIDQSCFFSLF